MNKPFTKKLLTLGTILLLLSTYLSSYAADIQRVSVNSSGIKGNSNNDLTPFSAPVDGRYVAFTSAANNLVSGDTNSSEDMFVHDRNTGITSRVSLNTDGTQGNSYSGFHPSISADGRYVAFSSVASNLVSGDTNGV